jgi:hypothetical protein
MRLAEISVKNQERITLMDERAVSDRVQKKFARKFSALP